MLGSSIRQRMNMSQRRIENLFLVVLESAWRNGIGLANEGVVEARKN